MGNSSSCTVAAAVFLVETGAFIGFNGAVRCRLVTKRLSKWEALASVFLLAASLSVLARLLHNTALFGAEDRRLLHGIWISVFAKCEMDFDPVPVGQLLLANWEALRHFKRWAQRSASVPLLVLLAHVSICSLSHSYAKALDRPAHRLDAVKDTQTQITHTFLFFGCSVGEGFCYKWPFSYGRIITRSMGATQANLWPFFSCQIPGQLPTEEFLPADRPRLKPFECLP